MQPPSSQEDISIDAQTLAIAAEKGQLVTDVAEVNTEVVQKMHSC